MKKSILATAAAVAAFASSGANAAYVFVGSWYVGDGPVWTDQPTVYSAREAAALLFGGTASQYAISTIDNSVANINNRAHVDGYGDSQYLYSTVDQDFKLDNGTAGYDAGGGADYSAFVLDHSCDNRYSDPSASCINNPVGQNFAFRLAAGVPEPANWALMIGGFGMAGAAMRRRRSVARVTYA